MVHTIITKRLDELVHAYLVNVYFKFGGSYKILSDIGTELKNKFAMQVASTLGMKWVFRTPYYPQGNGCIEIIYNFPKFSIWKHVFPELAWDEVVHIACAAYNSAPN